MKKIANRADIINVDIEKFAIEFKKMYKFLYDSDDRVAGYSEAVNAFDDFLKMHKDFIVDFARFRGDCISSDREAAAFMFSLNNLI